MLYRYFTVNGVKWGDCWVSIAGYSCLLTSKAFFKNEKSVLLGAKSLRKQSHLKLFQRPKKAGSSGRIWGYGSGFRIPDLTDPMTSLNDPTRENLLSLLHLLQKSFEIKLLLNELTTFLLIINPYRTIAAIRKLLIKLCF